MKEINSLVEGIKEELCSAKDYSQEYLCFKAEGNQKWAQRFKEMATEELGHANYLHELATEKIAELEKVYTPPTKMKELWEEEHKKFLEKQTWIKFMLTQ